MSHDDRLLDALDQCPREQRAHTAFRVVREGRSVLDYARGGGRWNPRNLGGVLYAALDPDGACAEIFFHLSRGQSVFPSRLRHTLYELRVNVSRLAVLDSLQVLEAFGVESGRYTEMLYHRTQEIGAAADFLGFEALLVPNARWDCPNLVILPSLGVDQIEIVGSQPIDWTAWRTANGR